MLISMTHANLETSFDNNASAGEVNVKGDAKMPTGMYQLLYPDWGKKEDLLNPEWSVPVMKTQIHERQKKYGDNILYVFQKHYGFPKSGNFWYGKKYSSVFDFYIDTLVANGASDLKSIQEG